MIRDSLGFTPPEFSSEAILAALDSSFGLQGKLKPLEGERDQNHQLITSDGQVYTVKISGKSEDPAVVDFQTRALLHIEKKNVGLQVPRIARTLSGQSSSHIGSQSNILRVLSYLKGIPMSATDLDSLALATNAGIFLGRVASALREYSHPAENHFMPWSMTNGLLDDDDIWSTGGEDIQALESELRPQICEQNLPALARLRMQVVHNDAHMENLLCEDADADQVVGLIDFGDLTRTAPVCDLAILCLGFAEESASPEASVANVVAGYHSQYPLLKQEIDLVYDVMLTRETLTVLLFDFKIAHDASASAYVRDSRPKIMKSLLRLRELEASNFRDAIFDSCKF